MARLIQQDVFTSHSNTRELEFTVTNRLGGEVIVGACRAGDVEVKERVARILLGIVFPRLARDEIGDDSTPAGFPEVPIGLPRHDDAALLLDVVRDIQFSDHVAVSVRVRCPHQQQAGCDHGQHKSLHDFIIGDTAWA